MDTTKTQLALDIIETILMIISLIQVTLMIKVVKKLINLKSKEATELNQKLAKEPTKETTEKLGNN